MRTTWNPLLVRAFESVFRPWMHLRFHALYVRGGIDGVPGDRKVILASNHVSWWDGFLLRELHRRADTDAPLYTLMRADQLARFPFFSRMGAIGLTETAGSIKQAIRLPASDDRPCWLSFFPQGRIWPSWKRPLGFRRGLEVFARELAPCTVVPVALHLEPLASPAWSAFIGVGAPRGIEPGGTMDAAVAERAVEDLLDEMAEVLAEHGEDAGAAWTSTR
ncbi:MAG: lysophospholipid acyltransferase family protein [Rhodothermales bacterium]